MSESNLMSMQEVVAAIVDSNVNAVSRAYYHARHSIPCQMVGRVRIYDRAVVEAWIAERRDVRGGGDTS